MPDDSGHGASNATLQPKKSLKTKLFFIRKFNLVRERRLELPRPEGH